MTLSIPRGLLLTSVSVFFLETGSHCGLGCPDPRVPSAEIIGMRPHTQLPLDVFLVLSHPSCSFLSFLLLCALVPLSEGLCLWAQSPDTELEECM